jgi:hypothetical protein
MAKVCVDALLLLNYQIVIKGFPLASYDEDVLSHTHKTGPTPSEQTDRTLLPRSGCAKRAPGERGRVQNDRIHFRRTTLPNLDFKWSGRVPGFEPFTGSERQL